MAPVKRNKSRYFLHEKVVAYSYIVMEYIEASMCRAEAHLFRMFKQLPSFVVELLARLTPCMCVILMLQTYYKV